MAWRTVGTGGTSGDNKLLALTAVYQKVEFSQKNVVGGLIRTRNGKAFRYRINSPVSAADGLGDSTVEYISIREGEGLPLNCTSEPGVLGWFRYESEADNLEILGTFC